MISAYCFHGGGGRRGSFITGEEELTYIPKIMLHS